MKKTILEQGRDLASNLVSAIKTPEIEFLCHKEDLGVIAEPYPARKLLPDWYKELPPKINKENKLENSTIKRCAPFLDAMTVGWIIPLAADVEFITNSNASHVAWKTNFYRSMVETHSANQISTDACPHPSTPKPPIKFLNWWCIRVPEGYSALFVPPLNRTENRFQCMSGLVDVDGFFEFVNFPFFFNEPNYTGIVKKGTPLVQVIPIKRSTLIKKHKNRTFDNEELEALDLTRRKRRAHESQYRDFVWDRNK